MKTIKIIDLIKNIQNENPIEKFKYRDELFVYDKRERDYKCSYRKPWFFKDWDWQWGLNDEAEIIEEDKKIEEIKIDYDEFYKHYNITTTINEEKCNSTIHSATDRIFCSKINEIIDYINKEGGNNA